MTSQGSKDPEAGRKAAAEDAGAEREPAPKDHPDRYLLELDARRDALVVESEKYADAPGDSEDERRAIALLNEATEIQGEMARMDARSLEGIAVKVNISRQWFEAGFRGDRLDAKLLDLIYIDVLRLAKGGAS